MEDEGGLFDEDFDKDEEMAILEANVEIERIAQHIKGWVDNISHAHEDLFEWKRTVLSTFALPPNFILSLLSIMSRAARANSLMKLAMGELLMGLKHILSGANRDEQIEELRRKVTLLAMSQKSMKQNLQEVTRKYKAALAEIVRMRGESRVFHWFRLTTNLLKDNDSDTMLQRVMTFRMLALKMRETNIETARQAEEYKERVKSLQSKVDFLSNKFNDHRAESQRMEGEMIRIQALMRRKDDEIEQLKTQLEERESMEKSEVTSPHSHLMPEASIHSEASADHNDGDVSHVRVVADGSFEGNVPTISVTITSPLPSIVEDNLNQTPLPNSRSQSSLGEREKTQTDMISMSKKPPRRDAMLERQLKQTKDQLARVKMDLQAANEKSSLLEKKMKSMRRMVRMSRQSAIDKTKSSKEPTINIHRTNNQSDDEEGGSDYDGDEYLKNVKRRVPGRFVRPMAFDFDKNPKKDISFVEHNNIQSLPIKQKPHSKWVSPFLRKNKISTNTSSVIPNPLPSSSSPRTIRQRQQQQQQHGGNSLRIDLQEINNNQQQEQQHSQQPPILPSHLPSTEEHPHNNGYCTPDLNIEHHSSMIPPLPIPMSARTAKGDINNMGLGIILGSGAQSARTARHQLYSNPTTEAINMNMNMNRGGSPIVQPQIVSAHPLIHRPVSADSPGIIDNESNGNGISEQNSDDRYNFIQPPSPSLRLHLSITDNNCEIVEESLISAQPSLVNKKQPQSQNVHFKTSEMPRPPTSGRPSRRFKNRVKH
eukprot:TRINITY_DN1330_c2_g1_i1.p1 TRINITY_DN1330_c2_g1~~TRINITY_DN1330_c2_g1_i1.p1  ORF type:complete len:766 (+),score=203.30 TRINITY_DN1330_c2_g1_i1:95-2392(+)